VISLILVVLLGLSLLFLARGNGIREAGVKAMLSLYALIAATTEILSAFTALTRGAVAAVWLVLAVGAVLACVRFAAWRRYRDPMREAVLAWRSAGPLARTAAALSGSIAAVTLILALAAPPNTWDAMTYHMARVAHWIQQGSVSFYPTSIGRQNYQMPLASYAVLHLQLLSGADTFANLVQWFSFGLCAVLVSLMAKDLGLSHGAQALAALAALTLPTAVLQSSSTQNDLVCAGFCLAFGWFLLRFRMSFSVQDGLFAGLSLGLALLAKGTAYLFCAGVGVVFGLAMLAGMRRQWRTILVTGAGAVAVVFALNIGHWSRSCALYGAPVSAGTDALANETMSPAGVAANVVRNVAKHLGLPSQAYNVAVTKGVVTLLGREIANPKTTWPGQAFSVGWSRHEDLAGNALHMLLIAAGFLLLLVRREKEHAFGAAGLVALASLAGALIFCAYLKWQPWHMRLEIPLFMLALPAALAGFSRWRRCRGWGGVLLAAALMAGSLPFLLANQSRPLLPRNGYSILSADRVSQYFANQGSLQTAYAGAADWIRRSGVQEVGLMLGEDDWEYPLWVLTGKNAAPRLPVFRHVWVSDASRWLEPRRRSPEAIFTTLPLTAQTIADHGYKVAFQSGPVRVLTRVETAR